MLPGKRMTFIIIWILIAVSNVLYLISCKSYGKQYVGSTTTKFRHRFNSHKSRMRRHSRLVPEDRDVDDLINLQAFLLTGTLRAG